MLALVPILCAEREPAASAELRASRGTVDLSLSGVADPGVFRMMTLAAANVRASIHTKVRTPIDHWSIPSVDSFSNTSC